MVVFNPVGNNRSDRVPTQVACFLDGCELQDYIHETGWWDKQSEPLQVRHLTQAPGVADATLTDPIAPKGLLEVGRTLRFTNKRYARWRDSTSATNLRLSC